MAEHHTLGTWIKRFLLKHVVTERNLAANTLKSYRDTFTLLLPFVSTKLRRPVERLAVADLSAGRVLAFLDHLERDRRCSVQTRNQRLTAIRAFARYVAGRDATLVEWSGHIRAIPTKKAVRQQISWLTADEMEAMIATPDRTTPGGRVEHALLLFLYNTGARVSEAANLQTDDLHLGHRNGENAFVTLHGKGGKTRKCPLWSRTAIIIGELVKHQPTKCDGVFRSRHRKPYARYGIYELVERCAARVPVLEGRKITPHVIRHTTGCNLLRSGVDINTIRAWLGHVNLSTTTIYAEIDLAMKVKAMESTDPVSDPIPKCAWKQEKGVMAILKAM